MLPPSLSMMKIWGAPERSETKAMRSPSGDHVGDTSMARLLVRRRSRRPFVRTLKMSDAPSSSLITRATRSPAGSNTPRNCDRSSPSAGSRRPG